MANRQLLLGATIGATAVAGIVAVAWLTLEQQPGPAVSTTKQAPVALVPPTAAPTPSPAIANAPPPPWSTATPLAAPTNANDVQEIQRRIAALTANGRKPTPREVDATLADLQRATGKNEISGVDITALRTNLEKADQIQRLAKEMEAIAAHPDKKDVTRLQELMAQIKQLQSEMRPNVMVQSAQAADH